MSDLSIEAIDSPDRPKRVVVVVRGAIDGRNVPSFADRLERLQREGMTRLVIDMAGVTMVCSAALGFLVNLADSLGELGGGVTIACITPKVKDVFDLIGLCSFFTFQDTRDGGAAASS